MRTIAPDTSLSLPSDSSAERKCARVQSPSETVAAAGGTGRSSKLQPVTGSMTAVANAIDDVPLPIARRATARRSLAGREAALIRMPDGARIAQRGRFDRMLGGEGGTEHHSRSRSWSGISRRNATVAACRPRSSANRS